MCKYARLACMLDIIMCSGVNTVLITMINWIMLRAIMGKLKRVVYPHYRLTSSTCFCFEVLDP